MCRIRMMICLAMALCLLMGCGALPANASEDPMAVKDYEQFGAAEPIEEGPCEEEAEEELPCEEVAEEEPCGEDTEEPPCEEEAEEAPSEETEETLPCEEAAEEEPVEEVEEETSEQPPSEEAAEESGEPESEEQETAEEEADMAEEELQESRTFETVPLYFQTDYPDIRFGSGTLSNNGCSITSLAMVASYMTDHEYLPDELARYFGGRAENNIARLEMGSDTLQLPYHKAENWHETIAAIHEGKLVIVLVGAASPFTESQHSIVITGMNEEGRILVNDSYEPNYDKWELKNGFANGFEEGDILCGYSGAWIYDMDAMPEEPFIYYVPEPVLPEPRYPDLELTEEDVDLMARVVWVESRGECDAGQQAVAEVVLNRLMSDRFADNLRDVIYGEGQFRSAPFLEDAEPYQTQYEAIEKAVYGPYILPEDVFYFATTPTTEKVWGQIGGHIFCYPEN